jgi:hypothetical protein
MANGDIKTMNPADKFMTPRQAPPLPSLPRLNTATSVLNKKRSARSLSPKGDKSPWSPRTFFGLRSPTPQQTDDRGRSSSLSKKSQSSAGRSTPNLNARSDELRKAKSVPHTRDVSPQSFKSRSREASPFRLAQEHHFVPTTFTIPDEIIEEAEDDDNFASHFNRISMTEKGIFTPLAPPPSRQRSPPARARTAKDTTKPLPQLPEEDSLMPSPLRLRTVASAAELPRSHFSTSTISTTFTSPSDSRFSFSEVDFDNEDDLTADMGSGDEFTYSPILAETPAIVGFSGYSLPEAEYASEQTLRKQTPLSPFREPSRTTFGAPLSTFPVNGAEPEHMSALDELLSEMGYLGDVIVGK